MKTHKFIINVFAIIMLALTSCKKDNNGTDKQEPETQVLASDLLPYNLSILLNVESGLRVIYFNTDGNDIKATIDAVTARRVATVNMVNNTWVLDLNGDGSVIYTFVFAKKSDNIDLVKYTYKKQDDASLQMLVLLVKLSDLNAFANLQFAAYAVNPFIYLKFSNDHNFAISNTQDYAGAGWAGYYDLCRGAWKGKYNGVDYMGISVIDDPAKPPTMWVQKAGDKDLIGFETK